MNLLFAGNYKLSIEQINSIKNKGYRLFIMPEEKDKLPLPPEEIDVVVCNWLFVYHRIELFKRLKKVQLLSAGTDRIDLQYINNNKIELNTARGVYSVPMAEYVVSQILRIYKKTDDFLKNQEIHKWEKQRDIEELSDKKIVIVGMGSVGTEVAKKLSVFTENIIGVDIAQVTNEYVSKMFSIDELYSVIPEADIIILTLPLTDETKGLFDYKIFNQMKENSMLINIARGAIINTKDLLKSMNNSKPKYAVLDVFEEEPLNDDSEIWNKENVTITPHNSFISNKNNERMWNVISNFL